MTSSPWPKPINHLQRNSFVLLFFNHFDWLNFREELLPVAREPEFIKMNLDGGNDFINPIGLKKYGEVGWKLERLITLTHIITTMSIIIVTNIGPPLCFILI